MKIHWIGAMTLLSLAQPAFSQVDPSRDECSFQLVTAAEAHDAIIRDLVARDEGNVTSVTDFVVRIDPKSPNLLRAPGQRPTTRPENRTLGILRGYARALERRRQSIYYSGELFWTKSAVGVIFDIASGFARETVGVDISPEMGVTKIPLEQSPARYLDHILTQHLCGGGLAQFKVPPPDWAEMNYDRMAEVYLESAVANFARMAIHMRQVDLAEIRANERYEASLARMVHHKNLVAEPAARGRLIFDMASHGYGLEWKESLYLLDVLKELAKMTLGGYQLVLYWDPANFIELLDGEIRRH